MSQQNSLFLHEAIVVALINMPDRTATFEEIAAFIQERNLYPFNSENLALATQVMLRATKAQRAYAHLFEQLDANTIVLKNRN